MEYHQGRGRMLKSRDKAFHDWVGHFDLEHLYPAPMVFEDSFEERKLRTISFTNGIGFHMKRCIPCSSQQLVPPFAIYPAKSVKIDRRLQPRRYEEHVTLERRKQTESKHVREISYSQH